jgi:hypothetical protein
LTGDPTMDIKEELRIERDIQKKFLESLLRLNNISRVARAMIELNLEQLKRRIKHGFK